MHIPMDATRVAIDYDPDAEHQTADHDLSPTPVAPAQGPDFDSADAFGSPRPQEVGADPWNLVTPYPAGVPHAPLPALQPGHVSPPPPLHPVGGQPGIGGGGDSVFKIEVDYGSGPDQQDFRVVQANVLVDDDVFGADNAKEFHHVPDIQQLEVTAWSHMPSEFTQTDIRSPESIISTLNELGHSPHSAADSSLQEGLVVDGKTTAASTYDGPTDPTTIIPTVPTDSHANMAVIETGGNIAGNFGGMANEHGVLGTLVVLGDSYKSNAIVQTNVLVDHSIVAGTSDSATIQANGSTANNVAEFVHTLDQVNPYALGLFSGLQWHVDMLQGNYYDINLAVQYNNLSDKDFVQETATDHYKMLETGGNGQANALTEINVDTSHYDLVVVTGNYYSANWILQTNVLLNSDYVHVNAGEGGAGQETVSTGANWLLNDATLVDYSGPGHTLTPEMQAIAGALSSGQNSLDVDAGFAVPGNGSPVLNVLFINGDYYDLNVLHQTNVVNDSDTVLQTLANGESGYVGTGGNTLSNTAYLANVGPLGGEYVGGQQYSQSVLVQTNIISQSADLPPGQTGIVTNDPTKLAPEAAAIIQHDTTPAPADQPTPPPTHDTTTVHVTPDPLTSVLS
jgi:hypothetical protein